MKTALVACSIAGFVLLGLIAFPFASQAQYACGGTIPAGTKVVAQGPLVNCTAAQGAHALTIEGGASLDLNGFTVSCDQFDPPSTGTGILLLGEKAKLKNGTILDCGNGVVLIGTGKHLVQGVVSRGGSGPGFAVLPGADKCKLIGNTAVEHDNIGFYIQGDFATLKGNDANSCDNFGFQIDGRKSKLQDNTATANSGSGFVVTGPECSLKGNIASFNGDHGFWVDPFMGGNETKLSKNVAILNQAGSGFLIDTDENKLSKNIATTHANGDGISIAGNANRLTGNRTAANDVGIHILAGFQDNSIKKNIALASDADDLVDDNGIGCNGNVWSKNTFGTSSPGAGSDCIE